MIEYIVGGALAGALWTYSRSPRVRVLKAVELGAVSGHRWNVEYLEDLGAKLVVYKNTRVVFKRTGSGWVFAKATGNPQVVALIRKDFEAQANDA